MYSFLKNITIWGFDCMQIHKNKKKCIYIKVDVLISFPISADNNELQLVTQRPTKPQRFTLTGFTPFFLFFF